MPQMSPMSWPLIILTLILLMLLLFNNIPVTKESMKVFMKTKLNNKKAMKW